MMIPQLIYPLSWLCFLLSINSTCVDDNSCHLRDEEINDVAVKYSEAFSTFEFKFQDAVSKFDPCSDEPCKCFNQNIQTDLNYFSNGIDHASIIDALDFGTSHYQIINHKLYREEKCMFPARCKGVEHFLLEIIDELPDVEFALNTRDHPQMHSYRSDVKPVFSFSKTSNYHDILYPAWAFWAGGPAISTHPTGIGRWDLHRESISKEAQKFPWPEKLPKAFFRGSRTSSERDPLILLSRTKPAFVDAQYTKNQAWKSEKDTLGMPPAEVVSFEEHCKYRYLFNFRGVAASFRLKHLFLCRSLIFHVGSDYYEFFYHVLKPWVHYIPVDSMTEIEDLLNFVRKHDQIAHEIAETGFHFIWEQLTLENVSCYWKELLSEYAKLLQFKVVRNETLILVN